MTTYDKLRKMTDKAQKELDEELGLQDTIFPALIKGTKYSNLYEDDTDNDCTEEQFDNYEFTKEEYKLMLSNALRIMKEEFRSLRKCQNDAIEDVEKLLHYIRKSEYVDRKIIQKPILNDSFYENYDVIRTDKN